MHPWVMRTQVQIKGPTFFQGEIIMKSQKTLTSATKPILTKHGTKHPWVMRTQVCLNKGPAFSMGR